MSPGICVLLLLLPQLQLQLRQCRPPARTPAQSPAHLEGSRVEAAAASAEPYELPRPTEVSARGDPAGTSPPPAAALAAAARARSRSVAVMPAASPPRAGTKRQHNKKQWVGQSQPRGGEGARAHLDFKQGWGRNN